jgi:alpha-methylacyl-CoA racemase
MEGTDICFAPVLSMSEAPSYKHNTDRETFVEIEGVVQPAPAPRFSATPSAIQRRPAGLGEHTDEILKDWGVSRG